MKKIIILFLTAMICISIHGQANDKYRLKYNNPDLIVDLGVGLWGMPIPIDYDGDGLMDLLMTCPSTPHKGIFYFHNIGKKLLQTNDIRTKLIAQVGDAVRLAGGYIDTFYKNKGISSF